MDMYRQRVGFGAWFTTLFTSLLPLPTMKKTSSSELLEGQLYTVLRGRFKGLTGRAYRVVEGGICHALDFPHMEDGISFWGSFADLRKVTDQEKVSFFLDASH
jgi:hypothetical protein